MRPAHARRKKTPVLIVFGTIWCNDEPKVPRQEKYDASRLVHGHRLDDHRAVINQTSSKAISAGVRLFVRPTQIINPATFFQSP